MNKSLSVFFVIVIPFLLTNAQSITGVPEWNEYYSSYGISGSFLLYDMNNEIFYSNNEGRSLERFIPASTFKIPNSLIALETGVLKDENEIIKWDGVKRSYDFWNKDHNLRSAIAVSAVWFYQELARRIGAERMKEYLDKFDYGNMDIDGGIDRFWLDGELRISPLEQIQFLLKFYKNELPISQKNSDIVKDIIIIEKTDSTILRAKTGWGARFDKQVGWYVGYFEYEDNIYFFANNIDIEKDEDANARYLITKQILSEFVLNRKNDK